MSWNIDQLAPWLDERRPGGVAEVLAALGSPDILCLQEIRIRPGDHDLIAAMRTALPGYRCDFALADDPKNASYRGGRAYGVATYTADALGPVISSAPAWDREGRVLVTRLAEPRLAAINLYAVNGTSKPYFDHDRNGIVGDRHALKRHYQDRVFALAAELRAHGEVVIAGDFNVSQTALDTTPRLRLEECHARARAELAQHIDDGGFVDSFRAAAPGVRGYTWRKRAARITDAARVDFVLVSGALVAATRGATILDIPPALRGASDHAPIDLVLARFPDAQP